MSTTNYTIIRKLAGKITGIYKFQSLAYALLALGGVLKDIKGLADEVKIFGPYLFITLKKIKTNLEQSGFVWVEKGYSLK